MRLRGVGSDGEDLSDLVPELQEYFDAYETGVKLIDESTGSFNSTYDILLDLSKVWEDLTDLQKANLTELIAGKRQSDTLNAVLSNSETLINALTVSQNSYGSSLEENAVYMDSIQAKTNLFNKALNDLYNNTVDSDTLKWFIDFGTATVKAVDAVGLLNVALLVTIGYLATTGKLLIPLPGLFLASSIAAGRFATSLGLSAGAASALATAVSALWPLLIAGGIIVGIKALTSAMDALKTTNEELAKSVENSFNATKDSSENLDNLVEKYNQLNKIEKLTAEQKVDLLRVERELSERYGVTNEILEDQEDLTMALLKAKRAELQLTLEQTRANYMEAKSRIESLKATQQMFIQLLEEGDASEASLRFYEARVEEYQEEKNRLEDIVNLWDAQQVSLEEIWQTILDIEDGTADIKDNEENITSEKEKQLTTTEDLNKAYEYQKELSDERIAGYEKEIDVLEKQKDEIQKRREEEELTNKILEARERLLNAQQQRNVWTFTQAGGWELTADPRAVREATESLNEQLRLQKEMQEDRIIEDQIDALQDKIDNEKELIAQLKRSIDAQIEALKRFGSGGGGGRSTSGGGGNGGGTSVPRPQTPIDGFRPGQDPYSYEPGGGGAITDPDFDRMTMVSSNELASIPSGAGLGSLSGSMYSGIRNLMLDVKERPANIPNKTEYNFNGMTVVANDIDEFIQSMNDKVR